jgi:hypothetical protein
LKKRISDILLCWRKKLRGSQSQEPRCQQQHTCRLVNLLLPLRNSYLKPKRTSISKTKAKIKEELEEENKKKAGALKVPWSGSKRI